ncbi:MAG: response regulator [Candidatus Wallbacteria bacterium]|nr:response regulator [Candidatus Wallbacteria bacterium]
MDPTQKRILIVDDEADIRAMLKRAIERTLKIPADTASSGLEALEQIRETRYDLMVTDLSMPEMDGLALFRAVKERHPEIQVIVLTATASVETSMAAVKSHVYSYLTKPISMDRFIKEVEAALAALEASRPTPATRDLASVLAAVDKAAADIGAKIDRLAGQAPVEALVELKGLSVHLKEQLGYLRILVGDGRPPA